MKKSDNSFSENNCDDILLKSRSQYLDILNAIRKDTEKIIIVQIDGEDKEDPIVNAAKKMMTLENREIVSEWFGTTAPVRAAIKYTFLKKREFFGYLSSFESFFIVESENPYKVRITDFGFDDIAFLDRNGEMLFFTTTHEGYANLNKKYITNSI